ncbi:MAG TPA: YicC/YloC family endoribonuclease [Xanthobacteraceae bacterium]|jgi:uncharacterized protein (TIGR00255 family)|nr:YicC/YloC family endoribonuclease [Xanthobacteraceae bacterium]
MTLSSMTGFARADGVFDGYIWSWELKSVNAKGLEVRLRVPPGWDRVEGPVRARLAQDLSRGTVYGTLSVRREGVAPVVRVNEPVLSAVLSTIRDVSQRVDAAAPSLDGILALKGVIEVIDDEEKEEDRRAAEAAILAGFEQALSGLGEMRRHEGEALERILLSRLDQIAELAGRAEAAPGRKPEAIRARLAEQVAALLDTSDRFDADRLHQEAILIATKVDVREELDRLVAHVAQARHLLAQGAAVGRRLDFLAQEFNRETNTLCSKSNDVELTNIGLELKSVVEQFREQVQNLE